MLKIARTAALVATLGFAVAAPAVGQTRDDACGQLLDVIRVGLDRLIPGETTPRVLVALEAYRRLDCPVNGLLLALRLRELDQGQGDSSTPRRDSDPQ